MKKTMTRPGLHGGFRYLCALVSIAVMVWAYVVPVPLAAEAAGGVPASADLHSQERPVPTIEGIQSSMGEASAYFEENQGQFDSAVKYLARGSGGIDLFLTSTSAVYVVHERTQAVSTPHTGQDAQRQLPERAPPTHGTAVYMTLTGAHSDASFTGTEMLEHRTNYFKGSKDNWHTNVPNYGRVENRGVYDGIDMIWHGRERGGVQYDFVVAPGADASRIEWEIRGARSAEIDADGNLLIHTDHGDIRQARPYTYQDVEGERHEVASGFELDDTARGGVTARVRFSVGEYDRTRPLTIDPSINLSSLSYSTYLGGSGDDYGYAIAVDGAGNVYVTGYTDSALFPTTPGSFDTTHNGGADVFVTKLNAAGTGLIYSTFLGGSDADLGRGIAVDASGNAYVTGYTQDTTTDYPTTAGAYDTTHNGLNDVFVTKLNAAGTGLIYSTFLGGTSGDYGQGIAVDGAGNVYVTGYTDSALFPTTPGSFDTTHNGGADVFVTKLNAAGTGLIYSTFLGGSSQDYGFAIASDASGNAYVTGYTQDTTTDYPTTAGAYNTTHNGGTDAFVTKLNAAGSALSYSTFLGGTSGDYGLAIASDASGNAYVTGYTQDGTTDYPTTLGAYDMTHNGGADVFVTKLNTTGSALSYSTFLGGTSGDYGQGIAVDASGNAYVTGYTQDTTTDYPTTAGAYDTTHNGGDDAFVTKLNAAGSALSYSTFIGGSVLDYGRGIASDASGNAYVAGYTQSANFPTTPEAFQTEFAGNTDPFVSKFGDYSISGRTVDQLGGPLPNSAVALSGDGDGFLLSDAEGYFAFTDTLSTGTYLVSATNLLYNFNPPNYEIPVLNRNKRITFVGRTIQSGPTAAPATLGGEVHSTAGGAGLPFAQVMLVDVLGNIRTTETDSQGRYAFDHVRTGNSYIVFAQRDGYAFTPGTSSINFLEENLNVNFSARPTNMRPAHDFDGDGKTDLAVFRPSEGNWYILRSETNMVSVTHFGLAGDVPVAEDFDGDGRADISVFRPSDGNWYRLSSSDGSFSAVHFGLAGDVPVPADFDGDGRADIAVYRPSDGVWHRLNSSDGSYTAVRWGIDTDIPVPADMDSDGRADLIVYRSGTWYRLNSSDGSLDVSQFGIAGDVPVARDFDGDGRPDISVFRPSDGTWHYIGNRSGEYHALAFGRSGDIPVAADYDGDGRFDAAVFRPSQGTWMLRRSGNGMMQVPFGISSDIPVESLPSAR